MPDSIKSFFSKIKTFWNGIEKKRRNTIVFMTILFAAGLVTLIMLFTRVTYTVMYSGLDVYEAGEIYTKLTEMGADVKLKNDTMILIDETQEDQYRMSMATQGYPKSGLSYDIYTNNVSMGISESEKQTYMLFQLQDRLQNTIKTLDGVKDAIVTISKPDSTLFVLESQTNPITAAVVIDVTSGYTLSSANVKAIEYLVAKSMSGLASENITIIDTKMNILNSKSDSDIGNASEKFELQRSMESEIELKIASIMEPIYGYGNVKVAANIKMDYDKVSEEVTEFSPVTDDEGIVYSTTEKKETINETQNATADNETDTTLGSDAVSSEKSTQYYVNQSTKTLDYEQGIIEAVTLSIVINKADISDELAADIKKMAANAIGGNEEDIIVQAMEFTASTDITNAITDALEKDSGGSFISDPEFIIQAAMVLCLFILGIITISVFKKGFVSFKKQPAVQKQQQIDDTVLPELGNKKDPEEKYRQEIDKYVDKNPEGVADLLKKWINEENHG
jgi:flagellar M-ring protein FliF